MQQNRRALRPRGGFAAIYRIGDLIGTTSYKQIYKDHFKIKKLCIVQANLYRTSKFI